MPSFYVLSTPPSFTDNKQYSSLCAFMCTSLSPRIYLQISTSISLRILLSCCHRTSSRVSLGIPVEWFFAFFFRWITGDFRRISSQEFPHFFRRIYPRVSTRVVSGNSSKIPSRISVRIFTSFLQEFFPEFLPEVFSVLLPRSLVSTGVDVGIFLLGSP